MPLDRVDFDQVAERDLDELVTAGVTEGPRIDYKLMPYGTGDKDKREALKDISSFANTVGGHLVIGIDEAAGVATKVPGFSGTDPDKEILRLEQLAQSGIEPRIQGLRMRAVTLKSGTHCIVVRVPRSWRPPHRVSAQGVNRFYVRNSAGVHEASVEELRTLFTMGADAADKSRAFCHRRVAAVGQERRTSRNLVRNGYAILHIIPTAGISSLFQLDLIEAEKRWDRFRPIGALGASGRINADGLIVEHGEGQDQRSYTQLLRNGVVEAVKGSIIVERDGMRLVSGRLLETQIAEAVPRYMRCLRELDVPPPFIMSLALKEIEAVHFAVTSLEEGNAPMIHEPTIILPDALISEYGGDADYHKGLRPIFDGIWNIGGRVHSARFQSDGTWKAS